MAEFKVKDVVVNEPDSTGVTVTYIYEKVVRYAVYSTAERVVIQFADDDDSGVNQRAAIRPLVAIRSEIDGLITYLRLNPSPDNAVLVSTSMLTLGKGLAEALKGNINGALLMLTTLRDELVESRAAKVRTAHVAFAAIAMIGVLLMAVLLSSDIFTKAGGFSKEASPLYWEAGAIGAFGALFSIALQFRARSIPIALQGWYNAGDAVLRIFVGAASGTILVASIKGGLFDLSIGELSLAESLKNRLPHGLVVVAFAAGFTERLVISFLEKVGQTATSGTQGQTKGTNELDVTGEADKDSSAATKAGANTPKNPDPDGLPPHADEAGEQEPESEATGTTPPSGQTDLPAPADEEGEQEPESQDDSPAPDSSEDTPEPDDDETDHKP